MIYVQRGVVVFALALAVVLGASRKSSFAQDSRSPSVDSRVLPAEKAYKNIQALKGISASQVNGVMAFFSASLGVGCSYCHTEQWESDEKLAKRTSRSMIFMTESINKEHFGGSRSISCYTCHRGRFHSVPVPGGPADPAAQAEAALNTTPPLPTAGDVVAKFVEAVGGEDRIAKLSSIVAQGRRTIQNEGEPESGTPIEIHQALNNKFRLGLNVATGTRDASYIGFDGKQTWQKLAGATTEFNDDDLARLRRDADIFALLKVRETYPQMRVLGRQRIGNREAVVVGATARDDSRERLFFDSQSGLMLRRAATLRTILGAVPEVTDFDDYKEVSGVKVPFTIKWARVPFGYTQRFTEVRINVAVDDSIFRRP